MNESVSEVLREYPAATFIVGVIGIIGLIIPAASNSMREAGGLLGAMARKLHQWRQRAIEEDQQVTSREIADLRAEIRRLDAGIHRIEKRESLQHAYIVEVTERMRRIEIWAADNGLTLPPPPFQTYTEWLASRENDQPGRDAPGD
ncbi:hypothetical protein OS127_02795 [Corynebacterium sp. P6129]|uniref:hypothetical protein n=1 Tax=Corynebacterium antarcticum TaxID=2800405 RepID=UPI002260B065|nr:hypothetical protein [Corynebacterium antarcticum]MCX7491457.1 hypothetical protein [Corynebacterium antarcticum]